MFSFFQPQPTPSTVDVAEGSPVVMEENSSTGPGSDVEVLSGGGSSNGSDDGASADSEVGDGSGPAVMLPDAHGGTRNYCVGIRPEIREPAVHHYPAILHSVGALGVTWEARVRSNSIFLHAVETMSRGVSSPGCEVTVQEKGETCSPCRAIKFTKAYRGETA